MSKQPEGRIVEKILNYLNAEYPGYWVKIHGGPFQRRGLPDIIGCYLGRWVSIEVKQPGGRPTKKQVFEGDRIRQIGKGLWYVLDSVDDVAELMERLDAYIRPQYKELD